MKEKTITTLKLTLRVDQQCTTRHLQKVCHSVLYPVREKQEKSTHDAVTCEYVVQKYGKSLEANEKYIFTMAKNYEHN